MAGYEASEAAEKSRVVPPQSRLAMLVAGWAEGARNVPVLTLAAALLVLRPVTEVANGSVALGGHRLTVQQLWGFAFLLVLLRLLMPVSRSRQLRVAALAVAVAVPGILGALLGPVHGNAIHAWFWVWLVVLTLVVARERAEVLPPLRVAAVFAVVALVVFVIVLVNGYGATAHVVEPNGVVAELSAGFASPHTLAFACVALLPWAAVFALGRSRIALALGTLLGGGLVAIIFLTTIRTAQLAAVPVAVAVAMAFFLRAAPGSRLRAMAPTAMGALVGAVVIASVAVPSIRVRWEGTLGGPRPGLQWAASGRGWLWRQALIDFQHVPFVNKLFGSGVTATSFLTQHRVGTPYEAHSDPLELLVAVGIIGSIAIAIAFALLVRRLIRARAELRSSDLEWLWLVAVGALASDVVCSLFTGFMTYTMGAISASIFLGMTLGVARLGPSVAVALAPAPLQSPSVPLRRPALVVSLGLGAAVLVAAIVAVSGIATTSSLPAPPKTLVLATPPASPSDAAVAQLIDASKWARASRSAGQTAPLLAAFLHVRAVVGDSTAPAPTGTLVVDRTSTAHGAFVASVRSTSGTSWLVIRQPGGQPVVAPVGSYPASVLVDRPLAYWPLDDGDALARDYSGHGDHGAYSGAGVSVGPPGVLGAFDRSASFGSANGSVSVRVPGVSSGPRGITTVELWLRPDRWSPAEFAFGFPFYGLYERGSMLGFNTGNSGDLYGARVPHLQGRWHYVVAEFCNGSVRCGSIYVDGRRLALHQLVGQAAPARVSSDAKISGWPATPGTTYHGRVEQVAVYRGALPLDRIRAHYTAAMRQPRSLVPRPGASTALVLSTARAPVGDPALADLSRAVTAAQSVGSAAAAVQAIGPSAELGSATTVAPAGVVVVDQARTYGGRLVAYARDAGGAGWVAVRQAHGEPAFAPLGSYAAAILLAGPSAYWPLAETGAIARDYSGRGQSGSYAGGVGYRDGGALGKGDRVAWFYPDGAGTVSARVRGLPTQPGRVVTVELWLRPDSTLPWAFVFGFPSYSLYERGSLLGFNTGNNGDLYGAAVPQLRGGWHYVVAEFANGSVSANRLYVDGRRLALQQVAGAPVPQHVSPRIDISGWPTTANGWFSGGIEQVAVYTRALSPAQIRAHYDAALRERP